MPIQIPAKERCDWPPLAPHLIVGPDGQLSRLPFEMLLVSKPGGPPRYLVEEKTISYVGSGREVARLAKPVSRPAANLPTNLSRGLGADGDGNPISVRPKSPGNLPGRSAVQSSKSLVMGNPDFDFDLSRSSRREEAPSEKTPEQRTAWSAEGSGRAGTADKAVRNSDVTSAATKGLSRSYRGIRFTPLPSSEQEARGVAKLLGEECALRLGAEGRFLIRPIREIRGQKDFFYSVFKTSTNCRSRP